MLVATSEVRLGTAGLKSTLILERALRGHAIARDHLAFDTRFAAPAAGKLEPVGHLFMLLRGRLDDKIPAPVAVVLADEEFERVKPGARTFKTDGERVEVVQLRIDRTHLRVPVGLVEGPIDLPSACWDAAAAMMRAPDHLGSLLAALASAKVVTGTLEGTLCANEPERFQRLWDALRPLFAAHGAGTSLKQVAASLDMSMRQIGRDAKDLADTFGLGLGYRDALLVVRLRTACLLLSAPNATVADVAAAAGYGSPIAMARAFRDARLPSPSAVQEAMADRIHRRTAPTRVT